MATNYTAAALPSPQPTSTHLSFQLAQLLAVLGLLVPSPPDLIFLRIGCTHVQLLRLLRLLRLLKAVSMVRKLGSSHIRTFMQVWTLGLGCSASSGGAGVCKLLL